MLAFEYSQTSLYQHPTGRPKNVEIAGCRELRGIDFQRFYEGETHLSLGTLYN